MKAAIHRHSSYFNYLHSCKVESVEMMKIKLHIWVSWRESGNSALLFFSCQDLALLLQNIRQLLKLCVNTLQSTAVEFHQNCYHFSHYALSLPHPATHALSCTAGTSQNRIKGVSLHFRNGLSDVRPGSREYGCFLCVAISDTGFSSDTYRCVQTLCAFKTNKRKQIHI